MKKKGSKKGLLPREAKLVKGIVAGKTKRQAMRDAGYKEATVRSKTYTKVKELEPTIQALMEKKGLTDDKLLDDLDSGLKADMVKTATFEGIISDEKTYVDYPTRHKYLETALKLKGHLKDKVELELPEAPLNITINFVGKDA